MAEHIDAERAAFEAWAQGRVTSLIQGKFGTGYVYADTVRAWEAWQASAARRTSASTGEDGVPELPTNVAHVTRRIRRCESDVPAQVVLEHFAIQYARDAVATYKRKHAALQEMVDIAQANDMGYGPAPQAAQGVKTWQERMYTPNADGMLPEDETEAMQGEIIDLRAQLARQSQQKPVAWLEAESSARGRPVHEVILGMIYSSRIHTKCAPTTSNPVWPLYAAPPLSSEQQARLVVALNKIIEMNRQHALDQFGDANKAESWACVRVAREALAGEQQAEKGERNE